MQYGLYNNNSLVVYLVLQATGEEYANGYLESKNSLAALMIGRELTEQNFHSVQYTRSMRGTTVPPCFGSWDTVKAELQL